MNTPEAGRVVDAIKSLVSAAQSEYQDSMGTYYEEKELAESLDAWIKKYFPDSEAKDGVQPQ